MGPLGVPSRAMAFSAQAGLLLPAKYGIGFGPEVKSEGLPKKSQRSVASFVPLMLLTVSLTVHGCALSRVTMEFICQPSSIWANNFLPGIAYISARVGRAWCSW